ncbi:MAG: hypothetical protein ABJZ55_07900 [Fuerstiella sp.]
MKIVLAISACTTAVDADGNKYSLLRQIYDDLRHSNLLRAMGGGLLRWDAFRLAGRLPMCNFITQA